MAQMVLDNSLAWKRIARAQTLMRETNVNFMLLPVSSELEWLMGYQAHALERLTLLVVPQNGTPSLIVPELEVLTLQIHPDLCTMYKWSQGQDPFQMVVDLMNLPPHVPGMEPCQIAVGKKMPAMHLLPLQEMLKGPVCWKDTSKLIAQLRRTKDEAEIEALRQVAACVDKTIIEIQQGQIPLLGRTEKEVTEDVKASMIRNGHDSVSFCIVATGPNSAAPHHKPDDTVIERGHVVLFDIGGRKNGYSSDITRCVVMGSPRMGLPTAYNFLRDAQQRAFEAAKPGIPACEVDAAARNSLATVGLDSLFVHSVGHGIGLDEHEDPFVTRTNQDELRVGDCFSIEPGIYLVGEYGFRLEDIVVLTEDGAVRLNNAPRELMEIYC